MGDTLPLILNSELLDRIESKDIKLVGTDLDGLVTNLHNDLLHELMFRDLVRHLPEEYRKELERKSLQEIAGEVELSLGWFLDTNTGYLVLPNYLDDSNGKVTEAKAGNMKLGQKKLLRTYGKGIISLKQPLHPDTNPPDFLPYCDGFDVVEFVVKSYMVKKHGTGKGLMRTIQRAVHRMHSKEGFKDELLADPGKYGITANKYLKEALKELGEKYTLFLMSNSPADYVARLTGILGIDELYHLTIPDAGKPAAFHPGTSEHEIMWSHFHARGLNVERPDQVLYIGDHDMKDIHHAKAPGEFWTALRMPRAELRALQSLLKKNAGIEFERHDDPGYMRAIHPGPNPRLDNLNYMAAQILQRADVVTTKLEKLVPILLQ